MEVHSMSTAFGRISAVSAALALAAAPVVTRAAHGAGGGAGGTAGCGGRVVVEQLSGPTMNGVVPDGQATADESQFLCGGSTLLTVDVRNVNLPDGTVLNVSLDFLPIGTIALSSGAGSLTVNLGHFAVSNDEVKVFYAGALVLIGPFFR
jgi:hypothetical protein